jgi:hypothetical protein
MMRFARGGFWSLVHLIENQKLETRNQKPKILLPFIGRELQRHLAPLAAYTDVDLFPGF